MLGNSAVPDTPPVDRAFGAVVTFAAGSVLGYVLAVVLTPDATTGTSVVPASGGVAVGLAAVVVFVFAGGYEHLFVPVEGRRWAVELGVAFAVVAGAFGLADAIPVVPDVLALVVVVLGLLGTRRIGEAVADARGWYDDERTD